MYYACKFVECKSFELTPSGNQTLRRLAVIISEGGTATTYNSKQKSTHAKVTSIKNKAHVNDSSCHIASLEVYRGKEQAIEISHDGFSLGDRGTIEVSHSTHPMSMCVFNCGKVYHAPQINRDRLAYSFEEYVGELYRMNLSCFVGELPESGCLFFKVIGETNITERTYALTVYFTSLM